MGRTKIGKLLIFIIASLFIAAVILPVFLLFFSRESLSVESYNAFFTSGNLQLAAKSAGIAVLAAVLSTAAGLFFAFAVEKTTLPYRRIFKLFFLLPLLISPYIIAVAWTDFFVWAEWNKGIMYGPFGAIMILVLIYTPLSMLIISSSLNNINATLEESGEMMTNYANVFFRIVLPLIKPAIISSFILVFILSISAFTVYSYLSINTLITETFTQFAAFYNYGAAISQSIILVVICSLLLLPERAYLSNAPFISLGNKTFRAKLLELGKVPLLAGLTICSVYLLIFIALPILTLAFQAFAGGTENFKKAFEILSGTFSDSLLYAFTGALLLVIFSWFFVRLNNKVFDFVLLLSFAVPSTVAGIALVRFYNNPALGFVYGSFIIIILTYLGRFIFISQRIIANALKQIPASNEEAAVIVGANSFLRFRRILFPLLSEAFFAAFIIGFIFCLSELAAVILVYPPGTKLLPVEVYTLMANAPQGVVSSMNLVVLILTLSCLALLLAGQKILFKRKWIYAQS